MHEALKIRTPFVRANATLLEALTDSKRIFELDSEANATRYSAAVDYIMVSTEVCVTWGCLSDIGCFLCSNIMIDIGL